MQEAYYHVIVMLHVAFAAVFFFLDRQGMRRFARLFAACWLVEGLRAAIILPDVHTLGGAVEFWFAASDLLCFVANGCLLAGCADLAEVRLPRWLGPVYFGTGIPLVLFNRFGLAGVVTALTGAAPEKVRFYGVLANLVIMFVPVAATRLTVMVWLFRIWRKSRLPGALIAGVFCVPYAVLALAVPFQFYYSYGPEWLALLWCLRVLGFSIGMVMLMLSLQQEKVARSEANLAAAQALAKLGSWELNLTTGKATWSAEMYRLYGRDPAAGVISFEEFLATIHPDDREAFKRGEEQAIKERRNSEHEFRIVRPDGTVRWIQGRNIPIFSPTGQLLQLIGAEQDITERKQAESRVVLQHAVTRVLAQAESVESTVGKILEIIARGLGAEYAAFWMVDRTRRNLRCMQLWHGSRPPVREFAELSRAATFVVGEGWPGRLLAERRPMFVEEEEWSSGETRPRREAAARAGLKGAGGFPILLRAEIFGVVEFFTVETRRPEPEILTLYGALGMQLGQFIERQRLEEQYRQSQKLEAVGTLAGGIAHDFNNILTAINGYCELAQLDSAPDAAVRPHLQAVREGTHRAAELIRQIMAFSRQREPKREPLRLGAVIDEAVKLLRATIPATIEIRTSCDPDLPLVLADATSIHQVMLNLGTNASHAMKGRSGRLEIALGRVEVDADFVAAHPGLRPGGYVRLTVSDTGSGMDQATQARIFEPFFTTKAPGEGTGLGLAVVHGIVQSHDGAIFVYSQPGEGTKFQLYFPVHAAEAAAEQAVVAGRLPRGRGERVMYIDDERLLARMGKKILERLGYVVEAHEDAAEALAVLRVRAGEFALVVTDLTMPAMTGLELAQQSLRIRPDLPVILTSGYSAALTSERLREIGIREFLMKPLSVDSLGLCVHRVLAANARELEGEPR